MEALKQNIAEIDSAIIEARQWLKEAKTEEETENRQSHLEKLEADRDAQQAKLDAMAEDDQGGGG
ncbi:hypothetical protein F5Y17DRAFT_461173 [Xylariaceae sp. FL0594]|nr:hypothetical protein F5Y17DRAFT_461173 [Xylariaceae sp. FL0594]